MASWVRGKNFNQTKYTVEDSVTFIPHVRSNYHAAIPREIIENFDADLNKKAICLLHIKGKNFDSTRIKTLSKEGNSFIFSLKSEKKISDLKIKVLDIKNEKFVLKRNTKNITNFIPKYTSPTPTPIYIFNNKTNFIVGGHYKKELVLRKNIEFNDEFLTALGLYLAEGGKIDASFTNSWPKMINIFLGFLEQNFSINRKNIRATIFCNPSLKKKQKKLETFWKKETGIQNLSKKLHFGKNSRSPCGTLELYLCSKTLKEILISLLENKDFYKNFNFISGYFSGDASPILQTKYSITHQIPFDKKYTNLYSDVLNTFFKEYKLELVTKSKFTIYTNWHLNKELLLKDIYRLNPINRLKFAKKFLELPKTKKTIQKNKELKRYKKYIYPKLLKEVYVHYNKLVKSGLYSNNKMKVLVDEYNLS